MSFQNLSPGYVRTEITGAPSEQGLERLNLRANLPGLEPEDVADACVYLLSTPKRVQVAQLTVQPFGAVY